MDNGHEGGNANGLVVDWSVVADPELETDVYASDRTVWHTGYLGHLRRRNLAGSLGWHESCSVWLHNLLYKLLDGMMSVDADCHFIGLFWVWSKNWWHVLLVKCHSGNREGCGRGAMEGHWRRVRMLARERKQLIMGAIRGRSAQRGRSGFRPFWRTLMVQNRPHYWDIISIHTLSELMGALLGKIRFLSSVNIPHGRTDFLSSGRNRQHHGS